MSEQHPDHCPSCGETERFLVRGGKFRCEACGTTVDRHSAPQAEAEHEGRGPKVHDVKVTDAVDMSDR